jgi:hypothetical protein
MCWRTAQAEHEATARRPPVSATICSSRSYTGLQPLRTECGTGLRGMLTGQQARCRTLRVGRYHPLVPIERFLAEAVLRPASVGAAKVTGRLDGPRHHPTPAS